MQKFYEILDSIAARFKNPLFGAFAFSWLAINYKMVMVIIKASDYEKAIHYIENTLYRNGPGTCAKLGPLDISFNALMLFVYPLLASLFYVFILPAISLASTWSSEKYNEAHQSIRIKALKLYPMTLQEKERLENRVIDLEEDLKKQIRELNEERKAAERRASDRISSILATLVKYPSSAYSKNGANDRVTMPQERDISGNDEQRKFLRKHGIPKTWAQIIEKMQQHQVNSQLICNIHDMNEMEAVDALFGLSTLGLMDVSWKNGDAYFTLRESSWVALLNGRPA